MAEDPNFSKNIFPAGFFFSKTKTDSIMTKVTVAVEGRGKNKKIYAPFALVSLDILVFFFPREENFEKKEKKEKTEAPSVVLFLFVFFDEFSGK